MYSDFFSHIENIIIVYAPTVLLYLTQVIDWVITFKKFSALNVKNQVTPLLNKVNDLTDKMSNYKKEIDELKAENKELREIIIASNNINKNISEQVTNCNEYLKNLSMENIQLKAELRRKVECVVKEPENV